MFSQVLQQIVLILELSKLTYWENLIWYLK